MSAYDLYRTGTGDECRYTIRPHSDGQVDLTRAKTLRLIDELSALVDDEAPQCTAVGCIAAVTHEVWVETAGVWAPACSGCAAVAAGDGATVVTCGGVPGETGRVAHDQLFDQLKRAA